jgi:hypothetical protein
MLLHALRRQVDSRIIRDHCFSQPRPVIMLRAVPYYDYFIGKSREPSFIFFANTKYA